MNPSRGLTFTRYMRALGSSNGDSACAEAFAHGRGDWPNSREVIESIRLATVAPLTTGSDLRPPSPAELDFAEFIRPITIIGKLAGLRRVPSRIRSISATSGSSAYWAGEANPRPISRATFEGETMEPLGVTSMLVTTQELLRSSTPGAESLLSRDLASAAVAAMDAAFIDPDNGGIADVKPAAVTHGQGAFVSSGSSVAQIDSDLDLMINALSDAGSTLEFAAWVLAPRTATYLARLRGTGGALAHPGMTAKGGTLLGLPAITSAHVPASGSPYISSITLLDPSQILLCDDGGAALEVSEHGSIEMSDAPGAPASVTSLWQTDSAALKMTRFVNWRRVRSGMARVLTGVAY